MRRMIASEALPTRGTKKGFMAGLAVSTGPQVALTAFRLGQSCGRGEVGLPSAGIRLGELGSEK